MNEKISYIDKKIETYLNIFLDVDNDKIFEVLKSIGIETESIIFHDLSTEYFLGDMYYNFNCKIGNKNIVFSGNFTDNSISPNFITVKVGNEKYCYSYSNGKTKKFDNKHDVKNSSKVIYYEKKKNKRHLKKFFYNDSDYEKRLISILKGFGVDYGIIYVNSLVKHEDFYQDTLDFSFSCNCNDKNNSILIFNYNSNGSSVYETITLKNNEDCRTYSFDCLFDTLYEVEKPKVKVIK